jgi:hypothetical protein
MNWISNFFRRRALYDDLSEEIRTHLEERAEQLISEGMSPEEAGREARRAFGNRTLLEERSREVWEWPVLESIWADVRFAWRQLRRSPGFTFAAIVTMALAIGANAVVFSVMNAFLLRPLNVPEPDSLYALQNGEGDTAYQSYPNYLDLRDRNHSFKDLVAYNAVIVGMDADKNPSSLWAEEVSGNYFDALGLQPHLGQFFHASDERGPNSAPSIVLTHAFWHSHFRDDRSVVGRIVRLNKHPFTIVGVGPPEFHGTLLFFNPDFFVPMVNHPMLVGQDLNTRGDRWIFQVMGHLKPGVTTAQAAADLDTIGAYLQRTYPKELGKMTFVLRRPSLYGDYLGRPVRAFMAGLMLLTGLILLAACTNLGSLFAARAAEPVAGGGSAARAGIKPEAHSARAIHRGHHDFTGRGSSWAVGKRHTATHAQHMAANPQFSHPSGSESGCESICSRGIAGSSQRDSFRRCSGKAGTPDKSIRDGEGGRPSQCREADKRERDIAGGADCYLRSVDDLVAGSDSGAGALAARPFRLRYREHSVGRGGLEHDRL